MKKLIFFILIVLAAKNTDAQEAPRVSMTFNHVALSVTNLEVSVEFYSGILGLNEIANRSENEGIRWFSLGDGKELHLISVIKGDVMTNKAVHFAVSTSNFDAFISNLQSRYVAFQSWDGENNKISERADGIRQIYLQDPDGYWIEVNSAAQQ